MIVGLCVHTAAALPGSGTQQDPWRIQSLAGFDEFAADPNYWAGYTRLETDVNLAGRTYTTAVIASLTGVFDGNDHKITNLTIDGGTFLGLFGCIEEDGEVRNLGLEDGSVSGDENVGGLVGENYGAISNCYSTGDVNGSYVGYPFGVTGGLVGSNCGSISNCYSTGDVNVTGYDVGGLVGINECCGVISNCYSTGDVTGIGNVGGLVGDNFCGSVSSCYSTADVNGQDYVGGLVGRNTYTVSDCYSTGDVNGTDWYVGGLVGWNGEYGLEKHFPGYIFNSYSTGSVQGASHIGGLVGIHEFGAIERSFWDVETSGQTESCGGTGKMTAEMKTRSTFADAGWDFIEIWGIGENQTYPYLRFAPAGDFNYDKKVDLFDLAILASHWLEGITP
jgi:hypothetical protein